MSAVAPWPDFAGKPISDGDTIRHPDGTTAIVTVVAIDPWRDKLSEWRAVYEDGMSLWLGNQIGDKGQAIVISSRNGAE